jgi:hypothetical protein
VELAPGQVGGVLALDLAGDDEHRRAEAVARQRPVGTAVRVEAAVVEGDEDRPRRQAALVAAAEARVLVDRDRPEAHPRQRGHLLGEGAARDREAVVPRPDAAVREHRHRAAVRRDRLEAPVLRGRQHDGRRRQRAALVPAVVQLARLDHLRHDQEERDQRERQEQHRERPPREELEAAHGEAPVPAVAGRVPHSAVRTLNIAQYCCHSRKTR